MFATSGVDDQQKGLVHQAVTTGSSHAWLSDWGFASTNCHNQAVSESNQVEPDHRVN